MSDQFNLDENQNQAPADSTSAAPAAQPSVDAGTQEQPQAPQDTQGELLGDLPSMGDLEQGILGDLPDLEELEAGMMSQDFSDRPEAGVAVNIPTASGDLAIDQNDSIWSWFDKEVIEGAKEVPYQAAKGLQNAIVDTAQLAHEAMGSVTETLGIKGLFVIDSNEPMGFRMRQDGERVEVLGEAAMYAREVMPLQDKAKTGFGNFTHEASRFIGLAVGPGKLLKVGQGANAGVRIAKGAATAGAAGFTLDPNQATLAEFAEDNGFGFWATEYLASDENDSRLEKRFKNMLEETIVGGMADAAVEGIFKVFKSAKSGKDLAPEELEAIQDAIEAEVKKFESNATVKPEPRGQIGEPRATDNVDKAAFADNNPADAATPSRNLESKSAETYQYELFPDQGTASKVNENLADHADEFLKDGDIRSAGSAFNMAKINDVESLDMYANVINKAREMDPEAFARVSDQHINELAEMIGSDPVAIKQLVNSKVEGTEGLEVALLSGRQRMLDLSDAMKASADRYAQTGNATDLTNLLRDAEEATTLTTQVKLVQARTARALRGLRNVGDPNALAKALGDDVAAAIKSGPERQTLELIARIRKDPSQAQALVARIRFMDDSKNIIKTMSEGASSRGNWWSSFWSGAEGLYLNNLLSGLGTQAANMSSGALATAFKPLDDVIGGALGGNRQQVVDGMRQYKHVGKSLIESLKLSGKVFNQGRNILDPTNMTNDAGKNIMMPKQLIGARDADTVLNDAMNVFANPSVGSTAQLGKSLLNTGITVGNRMLMSGDEFFKQLNYRGRKGVEIDKQLDRLRKEGASVNEIKAAEIELRKTMFNPDGTPTDGFNDAIQYAREATFTNDLLEGTLMKSLQDGINAMDNGAVKTLTRTVFPFVRTPTNIMRYSWQRMPGFNLLQKQFREELTSNDAVIRNRAKAKMAQGVAATGAFYYMAEMDMITGGGPRDAAARATWMKTNRPYSIKIPQTDENGEPVRDSLGNVKYDFVSYMRGVDPFTGNLALIADAVEYMTATDDPALESEITEVIAGTMMAGIQNIGERTYTRSLRDFIAVFSGEERGGKTLSKFMQTKAADFAIPRSVSQFNDDEYVREANGVMEEIRKRLPGFSEDLPARRTPLGDFLPTRASTSQSLLNPWWSSEPVNDPVQRELTDIGFKMSYPTSNFDGIDIKESRFNLANGQNAYQRYIELIGTSKSKSGLTLKESLYKEMRKDRWNDLTDDARVMAVEKVYSAYKKTAKAKLIKENPELRTITTRAKRNNLADITGDNLVNLETGEIVFR